MEIIQEFCQEEEFTNNPDYSAIRSNLLTKLLNKIKHKIIKLKYIDDFPLYNDYKYITTLYIMSEKDYIDIRGKIEEIGFTALNENQNKLIKELQDLIDCK